MDFPPMNDLQSQTDVGNTVMYMLTYACYTDTPM